jgi:hypothetical protein
MDQGLNTLLLILTVAVALGTLIDLLNRAFSAENRGWKFWTSRLALCLILLGFSWWLAVRVQSPKFTLSPAEQVLDHTIEIPNDLALKLATLPPERDVIVLPFNVGTTLEGGDQVYFYVRPESAQRPDHETLYNAEIARYNPSLVYSQGTIGLYHGSQLIWVPFSARALEHTKAIQIKIKNKRQQNSKEASAVVDERIHITSALWDVSADCSRASVLIKELLECTASIRAKPQTQGQFEAVFAVLKLGESTPIVEPFVASVPFTELKQEQAIRVPTFQYTFNDPGVYVVDLMVRKKLGYLETVEPGILEANRLWRDAFRHKSFTVTVIGAPQRLAVGLVTLGSKSQEFLADKRDRLREGLAIGSVTYLPVFSEVPINVPRPFLETIIAYGKVKHREVALQIGRRLGVSAKNVLPADQIPAYIPHDATLDQVDVYVAFGSKAR